MEDTSTARRQFKLFRENYRLNIKYSLTECYKHSFEKAIAYLNYDDDKNIDVKTEAGKFEDILHDFSFKNFGWYLVPKYVEYKTNANWFEYSYVVEFVLKRKTVDESSAD